MSQSMPAKPKVRLRLQPNPFGSSALGTPWAGEVADLPSINKLPFDLIVSALRQMRAGANGTSIVLTGDPGSGKTHLLSRVKSWLQVDTKDARPGAIYVYVRCHASSGTLWRHLRHALASDLLRGAEASQLYRFLLTNANRLDEVNHLGVSRVLQSIQQGRHYLIASAWLRGENLGPADLAVLGFPPDGEQEDNDREREAKLVVDALLNFLAPLPVVLCFDQVEALQTFRGDEAGFHALAQMVSELCNGHQNLLLISCLVSAFEELFDRLPSQADRHRWLRAQGTLKAINWDQASELIKLRLDNAPDLQTDRSKHPEDPLWPIDTEPLKQLFLATGVCLARILIRACEQQFNSLIDPDLQPAPRKPLPDFLATQYAAALSESRPIAAKQSLSKTLSDCLPWLLQNSNLMPLGQDQARARYANQTWRSSQGDLDLAFWDARGVGLFNQINRTSQNWKKTGSNLLIFRNPAVEPGARGATLLADLKNRGAQEIHPLPEALAALQAIRTLIATARSGELYNGDDLISEDAVTDWALDHLPPQVNSLKAAIVQRQVEMEDPILPGLSTLLSEQKIMEATAAASHLNVSPEEIKESVARHPMRFGLLLGPPVVVFDGTQGPKR